MMNILALFFCCTFFISSHGAPPNQDDKIVVNDFIDETLNRINHEASINNSLSILKIVVGNYLFNYCTLTNLKSLKRSGDTVMSSNARKVTINGDIILEEMIFTAKEMTDTDAKISVNSPVLKITINQFNFIFEVELDTKSGCKITNQDISWNRLAGTMFSENLNYNNTEFLLSQSQLTHLNKELLNKVDILKFLRDNMLVCAPDQINKLTQLYHDQPNVLLVNNIY